MASRLDASTWTGFVKKLEKDPKDKKSLESLDDKSLAKALTAFDKTDEGKPGPRVEALKDLVEQLKKQVAAASKAKKALGDKLFGQVKDQLYELLDDAEKQLRQNEEAAQASASAAESDDEEADSPALLTSKMVPLLRQLRKGEDRMHAMVCTAGANTAVLIMRRAISRGRRKLLAEAVDAKGGMKYADGEVVFEDGKLTFILQAKVSKLAKRLRQALLDQTQLRFKVKLRGEDGEEEDGEDEPEAPEAAAQAKAKPPAPPGRPASAEQLAYTQRLLKVRRMAEQAENDGHPQRTKLQPLLDYATAKADENQDFAGATQGLIALERLLAVPVSKTPAGVEAGAAFKARLTSLIPRMKQAQEEGHAAAQDAKLKASEAGMLARKGEFVRAQSLLDGIEKLLTATQEVAASNGRGTAATSASITADLAAARRALRMAREQFEQASSKADAQIRRLQSELATMPDEELREIAGSPEFGLAALTGNLRVPVMAALQEVAGADAKKLPALLGNAHGVIERFRKHLETSKQVAVCDDNPFGVPVELRGLLTPALAQLDAAVNQFSD